MPLPPHKNDLNFDHKALSWEWKNINLTYKGYSLSEYLPKISIMGLLPLIAK